MGSRCLQKAVIFLCRLTGNMDATATFPSFLLGVWTESMNGIMPHCQTVSSHYFNLIGSQSKHSVESKLCCDKLPMLKILGSLHRAPGMP